MPHYNQLKRFISLVDRIRDWAGTLPLHVLFVVITLVFLVDTFAFTQLFMNVGL